MSKKLIKTNPKLLDDLDLFGEKELQNEIKYREPSGQAYDGSTIDRDHLEEMHIPKMGLTFPPPANDPRRFHLAVDPAEGTGVSSVAISGTNADLKPTLELYANNINKVPFPELIEEMVNYYPRPILKEKPIKQRCYIGIDNGVSGSIGIIREDGSYTFHKTPTRSELNYTKVKAMITRILPIELAKLLSEAGLGSMVMIERPMVNPTRFKATVSALRSFEATITILETLGLSYEYIDSKEWQRPLLPKGIAGDDLKPASLDVGNRLYPEAKGVKHADRDGILIAHYCKSKHR